MTYCVALLMNQGMVFASDSRTNAGVDNIATFCKMKVFEKPGDRVIVLLSSGNLAITQATIHLIERQATKEGPSNLWHTKTMDEMATLVGEALRQIQDRDGPYLASKHIEYNANFLLGGQIAGDVPRLFHVYSEGNYIEASQQTPYFQIGETKYGKPIIDRVITMNTNLADAVKCVLVSFDSTMRSNISVGMPIDLACYENNSLHLGLRHHMAEGDPYFSMLRGCWSDGLRRVFVELPNPQWQV